jgi:hypothetical protein
MKIPILLLILFSVKQSHAQTKAQLIGVWNLKYSLQADGKKCGLLSDSTKLILNKNGTYQWNDYGAITTGNWVLLKHKIKLSNIKAINFKATLSDVSYKIELRDNSLVLNRPEGVEIPCPNQHFIRVK